MFYAVFYVDEKRSAANVPPPKSDQNPTFGRSVHLADLFFILFFCFLFIIFLCSSSGLCYFLSLSLFCSSKSDIPSDNNPSRTGSALLPLSDPVSSAFHAVPFWSADESDSGPCRVQNTPEDRDLYTLPYCNS